jgi:hypothetical protein
MGAGTASAWKRRASTRPAQPPLFSMGSGTILMYPISSHSSLPFQPSGQ